MPTWARRRWLDVDGIRTRYFDEGAGAPVVMIHGAQIGARDGASSAKTWALNFPVLRNWHNVIAFDKLGQGYTDNPEAGLRLHDARHRAACHRLPRKARQEALTIWSGTRAAAMW